MRIVIFRLPYWIDCATMMFHGRRIDTVNTLVMIVEMIMQEQFAVNKQNILVINPLVSQVLYFFMNLKVYLHPSQVFSLLLLSQASPLQFHQMCHPIIQADILQDHHP